MARRGQVIIFFLAIGIMSAPVLCQENADDGIESGDSTEFGLKPESPNQESLPENPTVSPDEGASLNVLAPVPDSEEKAPTPYLGQDLPIDPAIQRSLESASDPKTQAQQSELGIDPASAIYRKAISRKIAAGDKKGLREAVEAALQRFPDDPTFQGLQKLTRTRLTQAHYDRIIAKTMAEGRKLFGVQVTFKEDPRAVRPGTSFFSRDVLTRAYAQINNGDDARAEKILSAALKRDGSRGAFYAARSQARRRLGDAEGADADSLMAVKLDPGDSSAYTNRAKLMREMGRKTEILGWLNRALRLNPLDEVALLERGMYHWNANRGDLAVADYKRAAQIDPQNYDIYRKAARLIPSQDTRLYTERGSARLAQKDYAGALADASRALALMPDNAKARNIQLLALINMGQYAEAMKESNKVLKLNPRDARALVVRARALQKLGNQARAQEDLKRAAEIDPRLAQEP